jgi:hypothetical protein
MNAHTRPTPTAAPLMTTDSRYHFDSMSPREQTISTRSAILGGLRAAADIAAELTARLAEMRALAATERDTGWQFLDV